MRKAISPRKRTAITLYYMSSTVEYRTIANLVDVSTSFVCLCIREVCKAITKKLKNNFLSAILSELRADLHMLYQIGADQRCEGSSEESWFSTANRLHCTAYPSWARFQDRVPILSVLRPWVKVWSSTDGAKQFTRQNLSVPNQFFWYAYFFHPSRA